MQMCRNDMLPGEDYLARRYGRNFEVTNSYCVPDSGLTAFLRLSTESRLKELKARETTLEM